MTDEKIQRKLNQLSALANELDAEAKRRWGREAHLFFEADGAFHMMDSEAGGESVTERQSHSKFQSQRYCRLGVGCW